MGQKIIKISSIIALLLLFSSSLVFAQEENYLVLFDNDSGSDSESAVSSDEDLSGEDACGIGCDIWQILFGSKEARAGRAWWDRDALAGEAVKEYGDWYCTDGFCICTNNAGCTDKNGATVLKGRWQSETEVNPAQSGAAPPETTSSPQAAQPLSQEAEIAINFPFQVSRAKEILGAQLYDQYENFIDWIKSGQVPGGDKDTIVYTLANNMGTLTAVTDAQGYVTVTGNVPSTGPQKPGQPATQTSWQVLRKGGQTIASQTAQQRDEGVMVVGLEGQQQTVTVGKGVAPSQLKNGAVVYSEDKNSAVQFAQNQLTVTDFEKETQTVFNAQTGERREYLGGDSYTKGDGSCAQDRCFVPASGTATLIDAQGKPQTYLADLSYEQDGAERVGETPEIEYRNPRTGRLEGAQLRDGTTISAMRGEEGYSGMFEVASKTPSGEVTKLVVHKDAESGEWVGLSNIADAKLREELTKKLNDIESSTIGSLATAQTALESIYSLTNSIKSYPAISQLLFGDTEFYKDWQRNMDIAFAPMIGENWFPSAICENSDLHWREIEPAGKAVIKTPSGTYQAVASIQMERSAVTSPILCHRNPDQEADEQFICERRQVCIDESFCYADKDRDEEPDEEEPLEGYFYKITWAVSAPRDEALTPLVDENGVAVSFNIVLRPGNVPLYDLNGNTVSPIQLNNGISDKDTIIKYSPKVYDQACIVWDQPPMSAGIAGEGLAAGFEEIGNVCYGIDDEGFISSVGEVNWERSGKEAASITHNKGEVSRNTDW